MANNSEEYARTLEQGIAALRQGDSIEAQALLQRAVDLGLDNAQVAEALAMLGRAHGTAGQYERAEEALHEALRRSMGLPGVHARAKIQLGIVRYQTGQVDAARYFLEEAEQELKRQGDQQNRSIALGNLGMILVMRGEYQQAIDALRTSIELCEALNDLIGVSIQLSNLGEAYLDLGDPAGAQELVERAIRLADLLGSDSMQVNTQRNLGMDLAAQGRLAEGRAIVERALQLATTYHQADAARQCQASLAEVQYLQGEYEAALATAEALQEASGESSVRRAQARLIIGRCQAARRQPQRALLTLEAGLVDAQVSTSKMLVLRLHAALAQIGTHPAIAQVHRRIGAQLATQIATSLEDQDLRTKFERSALYRLLKS